ncbi:MAG: hypothetical protein SGI72_11060 [Planctomycetota bacterium]|nr:hypothetical protein [Planctomycetota bacterium]
MSANPEHSATTGLTLGGLLVGVGGALLGLQIDQNGSWSGTGWTAFAIGALLALGAMLLRAKREGSLPRDRLGIFAIVTSFAALTFVLSGVLAPGGPWMFFEIALLAAVVVFKRPQERAGGWIGYGVLGLLAALLFFKLWIAYQGSENRWALMSVNIPVLSWLPFEFLDPIKRIALGSFTPHEMGFPPAGLSFAPTLALWSIGFALCVAGMLLSQTSAREHENDRIHELIHTLPSGLANFVERILPEEEWHALGLHGLPERRLARRIEALVSERMARQNELQSALDAGRLLSQTNPGGFAGGIYRAIVDPDPRRDAL